MMSEGISSAVPKDAHARVATPVRIHSFKAQGQHVSPPKVAKPIPPAVREYLFSTLSAEEAWVVPHAGSTGITVSAAFKADKSRRQHKAKAAASQSAHSRLQTTSSSASAAAAAAAPTAKRSSSVHRRTSTSKGGGPTLEKELCERLDITWVGARGLITEAKNSLGLEPNDGAAEDKHRDDILELAAEENRANPRKSRPKVVKRASASSVSVSSSTTSPETTKKKDDKKKDKKSSSSSSSRPKVKKAYSVSAHMQAYLDRPDDDDAESAAAAIKKAVAGGITSAAPRPVTPTKSRPKPVKQYSVPAGVQAYLDRPDDDGKERGSNPATPTTVVSNGEF